MAKRMLDCYASDFAGFSKEELLESVRRSEGRVMLCETIGTVRPMLGDVTNAEFAAAMGADFLLLNMFDVNEPKIEGLPAGQPEDTVRLIKRLTGRPVGINLEPMDTGGGCGYRSAVADVRRTARHFDECKACLRYGRGSDPADR